MATITEFIIKNPKSIIGRIVVDRDLCIGAATCTVIAPGTYELDSEGKVNLLENIKDTDELIIDGARSCPVYAIKIYDKQGKLIYPV
jgi:ferredoxin